MKSLTMVRLLLLTALLAGVILFLLQNWSPSIALVFLGVRSRALPLALWILLVGVAGMVSILLLQGLFQLVGYLAVRRTAESWEADEVPPDRSPPSGGGQGRAKPAPSDSARPRPEASPQDRRQAPAPRRPREEVPTPRQSREKLGEDLSPEDLEDEDLEGAEPSPRDEADPDDWAGDETSDPDLAEDDWEKPPTRRPKKVSRRSQPAKGSKPGPASSHPPRIPPERPSAVGRAESVYDADYRVIIPPQQAVPAEPETAPQSEVWDDEDDWGTSKRKQDWDF